MIKPFALLISCEHAVNTVPSAYRGLFHGHESILQTHRAVDIGAFDIACHLSQRFPCDFMHASVSRLLIDCNRSLSHAHCFSEFTKKRPESEKQHLIDGYYRPFREPTENLIKSHIQQGLKVLHLSIHSFTPELHGKTRNADIGLLYDHTRLGEQAVARIWRGLLRQQAPAYSVRMNYPYHGKTDGFASALRKQYSENDYLGFEVECNQALVSNKNTQEEMAFALSSSLSELLPLL